MFLDCLTLVNDRLSSVRARLLKVGDLATNQTVAGVSRRCFVEDAILAAAGEEGSSSDEDYRSKADHELRRLAGDVLFLRSWGTSHLVCHARDLLGLFGDSDLDLDLDSRGDLGLRLVRLRAACLLIETSLLALNRVCPQICFDLEA